jgi:hypothetical protein
MTRRIVRHWVGLASVVLLGLIMSLAVAAPAGAAGSGYNPTPPPPTSPPAPTPCPPAGTVISSLTIPPGGGTVSGTVDGSVVTVTVPAGSFPDGAVVAIVDTSPTAVAPTGNTIVLAFGIYFCVNGAKFTGTFSPSATVTVTNPGIRPGQTFFEQIGTTLVPYTAQIVDGTLTLTIDSDPAFVLVTAVGPASSVIPGATNVVTGKPFVLEGLVGGLLVLAGAALLFVFLRLRLRRH